MFTGSTIKVREISRHADLVQSPCLQKDVRFTERDVLVRSDGQPSAIGHAARARRCIPLPPTDGLGRGFSCHDGLESGILGGATLIMASANWRGSSSGWQAQRRDHAPRAQPGTVGCHRRTAPPGHRRADTRQGVGRRRLADRSLPAVGCLLQIDALSQVRDCRPMAPRAMPLAATTKSSAAASLQDASPAPGAGQSQARPAGDDICVDRQCCVRASMRMLCHSGRSSAAAVTTSAVSRPTMTKTNAPVANSPPRHTSRSRSEPTSTRNRASSTATTNARPDCEHTGTCLQRAASTWATGNAVGWKAANATPSGPGARAARCPAPVATVISPDRWDGFGPARHSEGRLPDRSRRSHACAERADQRPPPSRPRRRGIGAAPARPQLRSRLRP